MKTLRNLALDILGPNNQVYDIFGSCGVLRVCGASPLPSPYDKNVNTIQTRSFVMGTFRSRTDRMLSRSSRLIRAIYFQEFQNF